RGGQRRRQPARPAGAAAGAADRRRAGGALCRGAGCRPAQSGARSAPADGVGGGTDPVSGRGHADLAPDLRQRIARHRRYPRPRACVAPARAGAARMTVCTPSRALCAAALSVALLLLAGCRQAPPQALGTLEYDRIALPAPAAERIAEIVVREGQRVEAGARILSLESSRGDAQLAAAEADVVRQREMLAELRNGARSEDIDQLRANLAAAQAQARDARAYSARLQPLGSRQLVAAAELDRARAAAASARSEEHTSELQSRENLVCRLLLDK